MTDGEGSLSERAAELRRAFDRSFAEPVAAASPETTEFISVRVGGALHAIRMTNIAGLFAEMRITPCPSPVAEFRGIAGFQGTLAPVYDLGALLGYPPSPGRWMVLVKGGTLGLTFDEFDAHFRVSEAAVAAQFGSPSSRHVHEIARLADRAWPVIDIPSIIAALKARATANR